MNGYRDPGERPIDEAAAMTSKEGALGRVRPSTCEIVACVVSVLIVAGNLAALAFAVWCWGVVESLPMIVATVLVFVVGRKIRDRSERRATRFSRERLARETEAFLHAAEDEAIRTRVFLPPPGFGSEEAPVNGADELEADVDSRRLERAR